MNYHEFQNKLNQADKPVVVDFWAPWCGPCRMTKPILEKLAQEFSGQVDFWEINADESPDVLKELKIIGIPTVVAARGGKITARVTGAQSQAGYRAMFNALAEDKEVRIPISSFDRMLRLGAGTLLGVYGIATGNWLLAGLGAVVAFLGIYDRCPIFNALRRLLGV